MRGCAELQRIQQEAEFVLRLFGADAEQFEHGRLHFLAVYTHRAAADLGAIQHHVVGLGEGLPRCGTQLRRVIALRGGEGMMHGDPALGLRIPLEHGEIHHPQWLPAAALQLLVLTHLQAQRPE